MRKRQGKPATYVMYFSVLLNFFCRQRAEVLLGILTMDSSLLQRVMLHGVLHMQLLLSTADSLASRRSGRWRKGRSVTLGGKMKPEAGRWVEDDAHKAERLFQIHIENFPHIVSDIVRQYLKVVYEPKRLITVAQCFTQALTKYPARSVIPKYFDLGVKFLIWF